MEEEHSWLLLDTLSPGTASNHILPPSVDFFLLLKTA